MWCIFVVRSFVISRSSLARPLSSHPDHHPSLTIPMDRPHQETREGVSETRVHTYPYTPRFDFGQPDPGRGRRVGGGQYLFVQSPIHPACGGRSLAGERQRVQGDMGGMYPHLIGLIGYPRNKIRMAMKRAYTTPRKRW